MTEDRKFREFFGCGPLVAVELWNALVTTELLPDNGTTQHMLWALMMLKIYAKEHVLAKLAGVDPKTFRLWAWTRFVPAIADLEPYVVRRLLVALYLLCQ